jgi:glycosyltransferase involved in cell wall biosynthesis
MNTDGLRILFLGTQMEVAGAQKMLLSQAKWFQQRGYQVQAVFFYDKQGLANDWQAKHNFPIIELGAWRYKGFFLANYLRAFWGMMRLWSLMWRNVDVMESYTPHSNVLGMLAAKLAGVPIRIATHHGYIEASSNLLARVHGWMINAGFASRMVAVSGQVRDFALEKESVKPERILVIENGIDDPIQRILSKQERDELRTEIGVSKDEMLCLTTGRLTIQKGHTILLKAIAQHSKQFENVLFAFAGDGLQRKNLENEIRNLGIEKHIHFLGIRNDIGNLLQAADLFVQPSLWEGLSLAMLEALFAQSTVLATKVEGVVDVITDGETGILVEAGNPAALGEAIVRLLDDAKLRKKLARNGQAHARRHYSIDRMCEEYEALIQELASGAGLVQA